jgi:hypothetical protein
MHDSYHIDLSSPLEGGICLQALKWVSPASVISLRRHCLSLRTQILTHNSEIILERPPFGAIALKKSVSEREVVEVAIGRCNRRTVGVDASRTIREIHCR